MKALSAGDCAREFDLPRGTILSWLHRGKVHRLADGSVSLECLAAQAHPGRRSCDHSRCVTREGSPDRGG